MTTLDVLSTIIPADQALANKALSVALQQINGIKNMQLPTFATAVKNTQTMVGLPLVNAQTAPVSAASANYYKTNATGSSTNKTYVISDFLGTAAGIPGTAVLTSTTAQLATMNTTYLASIYTAMTNVLNGTYGTPPGPITIPPGVPGEGTYTTVDDAMTVLIGLANDEITNLAALYPTQTANMNQGWSKMASSIAAETANQTKAGLVWTNLIANSQQSILSLVQSLPDMGKDTAVGGQAQFFESLAVKTNITGQSIIGIFRQGATTTALNAAGIKTSNNIPSDPNPPPPQANLGPTS